MTQIQALFSTILLLLCFQFAYAQLTPNSRIWSGNLDLYGNSDNIGLTAAPVLQQFLSTRFSVGGQINLWGTFQQGVQQVLLTPEIRYYFNPQHEKFNWFALAGSRLEIFRKNELVGKLPFQLRTGLGIDVFLGEGLVLENKLLVTFQRQGATSFIKYPELHLGSTLVYYLDAEKRYTQEIISPGIGRGSWMISGSNVTISFSVLPSVKNFSIYFFPRAGYFLSNRLVAGTGLQVGYSTVKTDFTIQEQNFGSQSLSWGINPFLRAYVGDLQGHIQPFIELNGNWIYRVTNAKPFNALPPEARNFHSAAAAISGGVDIFLSKNVALEAALNLGKDLEDGQTQVSLQLGFEFFLSRNKP